MGLSRTAPHATPPNPPPPEEHPPAGLRGAFTGLAATKSSIAEALVEAWSVRAVRRGMLGTLLIAVGSLTPAFLPDNSPWWNVIRSPVLTWWLSRILTVLALLGILLVMDCWFSLRPRAGAPKVNYRAVLFLWSLPMLMAPPIFSHDAYAYAAEGYMIIVGANPYEMGPGMLGGRWAEQVAGDWRFTRAPYGPLDLRLNELVVRIFAKSPYWSASLGMRLLTCLGLVSVAATLPDLARRLRIDPKKAMWFGLLNPLTITHLVGGAHNDAVMLGFISLALYLAIRGRFLIACALIAAATAVKLPGILAIVPVALLALPIRHRSDKRFTELVQAGWRVALGTAVTVIAFVFITLACNLGWGWIQAINVPGMVITISPSTMVGEFLRGALNLFGQYRLALEVTRIVRIVGMVVMVLVILFFLIRDAPRRPMRFLVLSFVALALGGPALHPWYLTWAAAFLAFARPSSTFVRMASWASIMLLSYSAVSFTWRNDLLAVGIAAIAAFAWIIWGNDRTHFREPKFEAPLENPVVKD